MKKQQKTTEEELNYESFRERNKCLEKTNRKLLFAILRASPKEEVVSVCKRLKILKTDLNPKTNRLEIIRREMKNEKN